MQRSVEEVLAARTAELMRIPGVEGVGQALCEAAPCIRVYIRNAAAARLLPEHLDGFPVDWVVTGTVRADPESLPR